jgi:hypothetical protein
MARTRSLLAAIAVAVAGTALLSACGSSSYSGPNLAKGLSAQQLQAQSQAQTRKLTTFVLGINGTGAIAAQPTALGSSALASSFNGTPIPIAGSGPVVPPAQFSLALTVDVAGTTTPVSLIQTGGHLYAVALGRNILLPVAHATTDLRAIIVELIHTMRAPALGSTKTIAGVPAQEISGGLDGVAASRLVGPVLGRVTGSATPTPTHAQQLARQQALVQALGQGTLNEWVRVSDLRPAELQLVASIANGAAISPVLEHAAFDITLDLSAYDAPQTITAPANAVPMSTTQLSELIGLG